jgi:predicted nucleic-acid-binding Zn-ribbon protein
LQTLCFDKESTLAENPPALVFELGFLKKFEFVKLVNFCGCLVFCNGFFFFGGGVANTMSKQVPVYHDINYKPQSVLCVSVYTLENIKSKKYGKYCKCFGYTRLYTKPTSTTTCICLLGKYFIAIIFSMRHARLFFRSRNF